MLYQEPEVRLGSLLRRPVLNRDGRTHTEAEALQTKRSQADGPPVPVQGTAKELDAPMNDELAHGFTCVDPRILTLDHHSTTEGATSLVKDGSVTDGSNASAHDNPNKNGLKGTDSGPLAASATTDKAKDDKPEDPSSSAQQQRPLQHAHSTSRRSRKVSKIRFPIMYDKILYPDPPKFLCWFCDYVQEDHDKFRMRRHINTHYNTNHKLWICCGVPYNNGEGGSQGGAEQHDAEEWEETGMFMVGGCGRVYKSKELYKLHLSIKGNRCLGDVDGAWLPGNRVAGSSA